MTKQKKFLITLTLIILVSLAWPFVVKANAAEPPGFMIIVSQAPDDLTLSLRPSGWQDSVIELTKERKAWESYFKFFYWMAPQRLERFEGSMLIVSSREFSFEIEIPNEVYKTYNNLLTLDLPTESLTSGQSPFRVPLLVIMRVVLTLLIEGLIFFLFGYRSKRSWMVFIVINLVTQIFLNILFTGPFIGPYWLLGFIVIEIMIIVAEAAALAGLLKEFNKRRAILFAVAANLASLLLGGYLIANLPV